ncbi:oxygen-dependent coproporphyrinogen oxidase [Maribellus comscasis]|uniref:coproporphyrinogen oxidase n=1 Tax=Maribellus comscasis TaxID=2681766 RepID=A0A6I6JMM3_9BACT|nr:oxygen-dependent coproporphyrinogen oxidase [Maribellus comscasis]QGY44186.1 oxygen-dependent coproporphyrinogen oxidase [Maribellus comscasis]
MKKIDKIAATYSELQKKMCQILESADGGGKFNSIPWKKEIGGGESQLMEDGKIIEKGAVNFSFVKGKFSPGMEQLLGEKAGEYAATGISSILHPQNPRVPVIHMNVRYFALDNGVSWFGGGIDLTPHIIYPEDAVSFHRTLKEICDRYNHKFYPDFKKWADDYFFLPHRNETRGIGGIFFDRLKPGEQNSFESLLNFTLDLANVYPEIYDGLMRKYGSKPFSKREKKWQNLRRGRYVEFNLIYDRGTRFGLESGGNTESILASLPADASWKTNYIPPKDGFEENTLHFLRKDIDWINFTA